jgi:cytochrome b561
LLAPDKGLAHRLEDLHGTIGEIFYWVIGLHILAALYHHWWRRDDTLRRML